MSEVISFSESGSIGNEIRFNGGRLKAARLYRGLTVATLAEQTQLQRQTISAYENGKLTNPTPITIRKISQVLDFPYEFFCEVDFDTVNEGATYFRALLTTNKKYRGQQIQKANFISRIYLFLSEFIQFPVLNLPTIPTDRNYSPEDAARELRKHWGLGESPIENINYLVEQNGILVTRFGSDINAIDAFSHFISIENNSVYLLSYSKNKNTASRIHFTIAHELGHLLLHDWSEDVEALDKDVFRSIENEANTFASAFLLPRESFREDVGSQAHDFRHYKELKRKWKVSISAMIRRSRDLGLIDTFTYQRMCQYMQKNGIMKFEPLDDILYTSEPTLLRTAVEMLLEQKVLTPKEFMSGLSSEYKLSLNSNEVEKLLDLPEGLLKNEDVAPVHELNFKASNSNTDNEEQR